MSEYVIRRLLATLPAFVILTLGVFALVRFIPGDTVELALAGNKNIKDREAYERQLGLDQPAPVQYLRWLGGVLRGDLGRSLNTRRPVRDEIAERLPRTLELGLLSVAFGVALSLPIGVISAVRQNTATDYGLRSLAVLLSSVPYFWVATMVVAFPAKLWGWSPTLTFVPFIEDPAANLRQFLLPALILGLFAAGGTQMRVTRTVMLDVLRQDYVRTAHAKGLRANTVILQHALRNALIPVVTLIGLNIPVMLGGTVIMESIFAIPGMGTYVVGSVTNRDYTVLQGIVVVFALIVVLVNLLTDLSYARLDPRIRLR